MSNQRETGIRIGIGSLVPEAFRDMPREEIEKLLMSEIRLKNSLQEFIIEQNLYDDYVIWRGK